jgi:outer membrane biogenesis lipoprotein LolB
MMASGPLSTMGSLDDSHYGDLTKLLKDYLGFEIPLQYMHYWVQGVPLPQYHIDQQLTDGFMQQSWKVEYLQYKNGKPTITKITRDKLMIKLLLI